MSTSDLHGLTLTAGTDVSRPWTDPASPAESRVDWLMAEMTLEEKLAQLGSSGWASGRRTPGTSAPCRTRSARWTCPSSRPASTGSATSPASSAPRRSSVEEGVARARRAAGRRRGEHPARRARDRARGVPDRLHHPGRDRLPGGASPGRRPSTPELVERMARGDRRRHARSGRPPGPVTGARRRARLPLGTGRGNARRRPLPGRACWPPPTSAGWRRSGVVATLKHFAGYSASRAARNHAPVSMGQRELRDVILPPFEMAIRDGRARSVMNSYADVDGVPAAADVVAADRHPARRVGFRRRRRLRLLGDRVPAQHAPGRRHPRPRPARSRWPPASTSSCRTPSATAPSCSTWSETGRCRSLSSTAPLRRVLPRSCSSACSTPTGPSRARSPPRHGIDLDSARQPRHRPRARRTRPSSCSSNDGVLPLAGSPAAGRTSRSSARAPTTR